MHPTPSEIAAIVIFFGGILLLPGIVMVILCRFSPAARRRVIALRPRLWKEVSLRLLVIWLILSAITVFTAPSSDAAMEGVLVKLGLVLVLGPILFAGVWVATALVARMGEPIPSAPEGEGWDRGGNIPSLGDRAKPNRYPSTSRKHPNPPPP